MALCFIPSPLTAVAVTVGHQTVLGTCQFFGTPSDVVDGTKHCWADACERTSSRAVFGWVLTSLAGDFRFDREYLYQRSMLECNNDGEEGGDGAASSSAEAGGARKDVQYALLEFEAPIICALGSMLIGSRLDADTSILVHGY